MKKNRFTMVEVVLALGVVAIGVISLMALFPIGFGAGRDAVAQSFAADSADQFLHWFQAQARSNWKTFMAGSTAFPIPNKEPSCTNDGTIDPSTGREYDNSWTGGSQAITSTLTFTKNSTPGLLKVQMTGNIADFSGIYRIWKDTVEMPYLDKDGNAKLITLNTETAVAINLEVSWPAELPYIRRQKHLYRLEIFKPEY